MAYEDQCFADFQQWIDRAEMWLTAHPDYSTQEGFAFHATCFDAKGRLCKLGKDFMRARDEDAFPVRWIWPDQIPVIIDKGEELHEALRHLAYAISPDHKNLEPNWDVLSYEPHFAAAMEGARKALGVKLPAKEF